MLVKERSARQEIKKWLIFKEGIKQTNKIDIIIFLAFNT
jgi:hypothetical protein